MRDPLPEARCCMTSLVRGTEYSDETAWLERQMHFEVLTEHRRSRRRQEVLAPAVARSCLAEPGSG